MPLCRQHSELCLEQCLRVRPAPLPRLHLLRRRDALTLAFVVDATLRFRLKLGPDVVEKLIEALGWAGWRAPHDAAGRRVVVHDGCSNALVGQTRV
jgi:hypothetical protein